MKTSRTFRLAACLCMLPCILSVVSGCHRDPIYHLAEKVEVRFNFDLSEEDPAMHVKPKMPSLMQVAFYDVSNYRLALSSPCSSTGGRFAVGPGEYYLVCYSDNQEYTEVSGQDTFDHLYAFTSTEKMDTDTLGTVIREPDHLLAGRRIPVKVPFIASEDTTFVIHVDVSTIMESYYIQVDSLKGLENISESDIYLTGHSAGNYLGYGERSKEERTLHFKGKVDFANKCLCAKFCTFGKLPGVSGGATIRIVVTGAGGRTYDFHEDITSQYARKDHILKLVWNEVIKPRSEGGFDPSVEEWDPEVTDVDVR